MPVPGAGPAVFRVFPSSRRRIPAVAGGAVRIGELLDVRRIGDLLRMRDDRQTHKEPHADQQTSYPFS